ncbi:hypothetical protein C8F01DRAFT_1162697 [Mycena amicta]|nr:hypothetical protein C8F01DRAFT_1162697 [Mycena amicta]
MSWQTLPLEIWLTDILPLLHPANLASLCATCSYLLALTRPLLYHTVVLKSERIGRPNPFITAVFSLLARDAYLANNVRALTLDATAVSVEQYAQNPGLVDPASMENMTRLKRLTIVGDISRQATRRDVHRFIEIIHTLSLDELCFRSQVRPFLLPLPSAQLEQLGSNVRRLVFTLGFDQNARLAPVITRLFTAAQATLTSVSLRALALTLDNFFALRFPHLRALEVSVLGPVIVHNLSSFLSAHGEQLEELYLIPELAFNSNRWDLQLYRPLELDLPSMHISPSHSFLPKLRVLHAGHRTVEMLVRARVSSLQHLTKLALGCFQPLAEVGIAELRQMLAAFEDTRTTLPALVELDFRYETVTTPDSMHQLLALAGPARTLQVLRLACPPPLALFTSNNSSSLFPCLRRLVFPRDTLTIHDVSPIFWTCETLEEMHMLGGENGTAELWIVDRPSRELILVLD